MGWCHHYHLPVFALCIWLRQEDAHDTRTHPFLSTCSHTYCPSCAYRNSQIANRQCSQSHYQPQQVNLASGYRMPSEPFVPLSMFSVVWFTCCSVAPAKTTCFSRIGSARVHSKTDIHCCSYAFLCACACACVQIRGKGTLPHTLRQPSVSLFSVMWLFLSLWHLFSSQHFLFSVFSLFFFGFPLFSFSNRCQAERTAG